MEDVSHDKKRKLVAMRDRKQGVWHCLQRDFLNTSGRYLGIIISTNPKNQKLIKKNFYKEKNKKTFKVNSYVPLRTSLGHFKPCGQAWDLLKRGYTLSE